MARHKQTSAWVWVGGVAGLGLITLVSYKLARGGASKALPPATDAGDDTGAAPTSAPTPAPAPAPENLQSTIEGPLGKVTGFLVAEGSEGNDKLKLSVGQLVALEPIDTDERFTARVGGQLGVQDGEVIYMGTISTPPASRPNWKGEDIAFAARHVFGKPRNS